MFRTDEPVPGVRRFSMARSLFGRPFYVVSCFQVGDTLIDTGCANQGGALLRALEGPIRAGRLKRVVLTHHHEDHTGNAHALAARLGAPPLASAFTNSVMAARRPIHVYRRIVWGTPRDQEADALPGSVGTSVGTLEVVPTPGHTVGDVAFTAPERGWLFAGDLVMGASQTIIRPSENVAGIYVSTRRLLDLGLPILLGSHRSQVGDAVDHLERRVAFLEEALERVRDAVRDDPTLRARPQRLATRLFGKEAYLFYVSGGDFARGHFVRGLIDVLDAGSWDAAYGRFLAANAAQDVPRSV